jgi:hypothetical protein
MPETFNEIMIKGEPELIKGFVIGFLEGRGDKGNTFIEEDWLVEEDSPLNMILHFFSGHPHLVPVIAETGCCEPLCRALQNRKKEIHGEVQSIREVTGAFFDFKYKTFSRDVGKTLLYFFSNLPPGVRMKEGYKHEEKVTPEGKGVEAYAPLHDYELKGSGAVQGEVKEIYRLYYRAGLFEVIELGKLTLVYGRDLKSELPVT